jgi:putative redox protein
VQVSIDRDQSEEKSGVYRLVSRLKLGGKLTEMQRDELLSVALQCPIHRLMTSVQCFEYLPRR